MTLKQINQSKKDTHLSYFLLTFFASLGFHFSTAYAIFYPVIIIAYFILNKIKIRWQHSWRMLIGFVLPFVPQILFELKNNFIEAQAVIDYLSQPDQIETSSLAIWQYVTVVLSELKLSFNPEIYSISDNLRNDINLILLVTTLSLLIYGLAQHINKRHHHLLKQWVCLLLLWVVIPAIAFFFLHFNVWYLLGMAPVVVVVVGQILQNLPVKIKYVFVALLLTTAVSKVAYYYQYDRQQLMNDKNFLPAKMSALDEVNNRADGRTFWSYHYASDIYDYPYQYLYFWRALQGKKLPVKFSYQHQTFNYVVQKSDLLSYFSSRNLQQTNPPHKIFFIIERPANPDYLRSWWQKQVDHQVINRQWVVPELELVEAQPLEQ